MEYGRFICGEPEGLAPLAEWLAWREELNKLPAADDSVIAELSKEAENG